jgi:hypothetical protein
VEQFLSKHASAVVGVLSGFDRLVFRGTLRMLAHRSGMMAYLRAVRVLLRDFASHAEALTGQLKEASEELARRTARPIRHDLQDRGAAPEIPTKSNRKVQRSVGKRLYRLRSRIECFNGHLKEQRRIATRYDKTATSFPGFVLLGCFRLWIRFVRRA